MPQVPRLDPNPVRTAPLPGVRVPTDIPARAFGSPEQANLEPFQRGITELIQREREKADTTALLDADNQLATLQTDLHTKALSLRGRDAMGATQLVNEGWTKGVSEITGKLGTQEQREAFANRVGARWGTLHEAIETHAEGQRQAYMAQTADDAVKVRLQHATEFYQQPAAIAQAVDETKMILQMRGEQEGWSPETLATRTAEDVTAIHASVLDRLIANRQDLDAVDYLTAHRAEMTGQQLIQAEQLVSKGSVVGASQRFSDRIVKESATLQSGLEAAAEILDPQVRAATEERVRRHFEDRDLSLRLDAEQAFHDASNIVRQTHSFDAVPPALQRRLLPGQEVELRRMQNGESDQGLLYQLMNSASLHPDEFAKIDLSQYQGQLGRLDLKAMLNRQATVRAHQRTEEAAAQRRAATDLKGINHRLDLARRTAGFYESAGITVPATNTAQIRRLQADSTRAAQAAAGAPSPSVPGAPLRVPTPAAGSGAKTPAAAKPVPLVLPGSPARPPEPSPDETVSLNPQVPSTWLEHAAENPDYAHYLALMGVEGVA